MKNAAITLVALSLLSAVCAQSQDGIGPAVTGSTTYNLTLTGMTTDSDVLQVRCLHVLLIGPAFSLTPVRFSLVASTCDGCISAT